MFLIICNTCFLKFELKTENLFPDFFHFISLLYSLYWIVFNRSVVIKLAWHMTWMLCKEYILNKNLLILSQVKHVFEFNWVGDKYIGNEGPWNKGCYCKCNLFYTYLSFHQRSNVVWNLWQTVRDRGQMCWDRWWIDHTNKAMGRAATLKLVLCFVWLSSPQSSPPYAQLSQSHQGITSTPWAHRFIHKTSIGLVVKSAQMKSHGQASFQKSYILILYHT